MGRHIARYFGVIEELVEADLAVSGNNTALTAGPHEVPRALVILMLLGHSIGVVRGRNRSNETCHHIEGEPDTPGYRKVSSIGKPLVSPVRLEEV